MSQPGAFGLYAADSPYSIRTLKNKLEQRERELVALTFMVSDWQEFCQMRGKIEGLREAISQCDAMNSEEPR